MQLKILTTFTMDGHDFIIFYLNVKGYFWVKQNKNKTVWQKNRAKLHMRCFGLTATLYPFLASTPTRIKSKQFTWYTWSARNTRILFYVRIQKKHIYFKYHLSSLQGTVLSVFEYFGWLWWHSEHYAVSSFLLNIK